MMIKAFTVFGPDSRGEWGVHLSDYFTGGLATATFFAAEKEAQAFVADEAREMLHERDIVHLILSDKSLSDADKVKQALEVILTNPDESCAA
jgi:hypothetical protein